MNNKKGITLIALIITIVIMLILVAVSINIAINTGLFKSAGDATKNWKAAQEEESYGGTLEIDGKRYNSVEEYMKDINSKIEMDYTVENGYIEVTVLYKGEEPTPEEYEQYMRPLLKGKGTSEKQQMFLDSENFWAEINGNPKFESLNDALESYNYSTWDELVEKEGNGNEDQALIKLGDVFPQYSYYVITLPDGTKKVEKVTDFVNSTRVIRTIKVGYKANEPGEYEFKAELFGDENLRKIRISLNQVSTIAYNDALKQLKPGDYVIYDTEIEGVGEVTCRVLYDATSPYGLQIITDDCIKKNGEYVYIPFGIINYLKDGYSSRYEGFDTKFKDYDFSEWYIYEGKEQYNDAIAILNNKAMEFYNARYVVDARCAGSHPGNKARETKSFAVIPDNLKFQTGITDARDEDDNYENDYNQLQANNILETNKHYWFASRYNEVGPVYGVVNGLAFYLRTDGDTEFHGRRSDDRILVTQYYSPSHYGAHDTTITDQLVINAFRPVFTLRGNLNVVSGDGKSESTAYRLGV